MRIEIKLLSAILWIILCLVILYKNGLSGLANTLTTVALVLLIITLAKK